MAQPALTTEDIGAVTLLRLEGEYDVANVAELRDGLGVVATSGRPIVVVLTMASFIDSTILGVLLGALRRAKEERRGFVFALEPDASSGAIDRLLEMSGLLRIFPVYSSIDEATAAAAGGINTPPIV
jgi:anti-sigma B factor antagonist